MFKFLIIQLLFLFTAANIHAQNVKDFELSVPAAKATGGRYHKFRFLDSRPDVTNMGFVQTGFFNRKAIVVTKTPFAAQLKSVFAALVDTAAGDGEMLFQLRQFNFAEITAGMSEKGYFFIRAGLYANKAGGYQKIKAIDTLLVLSSGIDVTLALLKTAKDTINGFIASGLNQQSAGALFSLHDLTNIDSVEKSGMKLYNTSVYTDGLYLNYTSFMKQEPDKQIKVEGADLNTATVKTMADNGKWQKVKAQKVYAMVVNGQPYVSSLGQYYPLKKEKGEFYFTGKALTSATAGQTIAATVLFGTMGALLTANNGAVFEMQIDHFNGSFIKLKEIPQPSALDYHPNQTSE